MAWDRAELLNVGNTWAEKHSEGLLCILVVTVNEGNLSVSRLKIKVIVLQVRLEGCWGFFLKKQKISQVGVSSIWIPPFQLVLADTKYSTEYIWTLYTDLTPTESYYFSLFFSLTPPCIIIPLCLGFYYNCHHVNIYKYSFVGRRVYMTLKKIELLAQSNYDWIIKMHVYTLVGLESNWVSHSRIKTPR